jgi:5-formyltetrahydrofolate cyclo-ligase
MAVPPPPPESAHDAKAELRRQLRGARRAFVASLDTPTRAAALTAIQYRLSPLLAQPGSIAGYVAHRSEVDILPFLLSAFHLGRKVALPHITADGRRMRFTAWHPDAALTPGLAGIPQPAATGKALVPDMLLVPLVGFDRSGNRIGQGGGFYDRWFEAHPHAMRVGVAWSAQETAPIVPDPWDMPLHAIVTEREWIAP